jgi:tRNA threonylcarbamoyladenosine biosynthesis protein TsaE
MIQLTIPDAEAMEALGARLGPLLDAGDLLLLNGELGAGKTTLTRGLGAALGARGAVTSPTFVLAREHPTASGVPLVHVDAYRLATGRELDDLDLDYGHAIVVVEWGVGKLDGVSESWVSIDIERPRGAGGGENVGVDLDADEPRHVTITGTGPRGVELEAALAANE